MKKVTMFIIMFLVSVVFNVSCFSQEPLEMIDWNAPVSMYERTMGPYYILPKGWEEAIKAEGTKSITFINSGSISGDPAMELNISYFEKLTGIDVIYEEVGEDDINTKQVTTLSAQLPHYDLLFLTTFSEPIVDYARSGWLVPVDMLWDDKIASVYSPEMVEAMNLDGHIYAFPYIGWTVKLHYREDLFQQVGFSDSPKTWDEFIEYAQKLTIDINGDGLTDRWGFAYHCGDRYSTMMTFGQCLVANNGVMFQDGKILVDTPEAREALQFLVDLRNSYEVVPPGVNTYNYVEALDLFTTDKVAMVGGPIWAHLNIRTNPEVYQHYKMAHFPVAKANLDPRRSFYDFSFYGVSAYSNNKAAALLFLDFLRSYQARHTEVYVENNVVPNRLVWESPEVALTMPFVDVRLESVENAVFWIYPNATKVIDIIHEEIGYALLQQKSPESSLKDAQSRIDRLFR